MRTVTTLLLLLATTDVLAEGIQSIEVTLVVVDSDRYEEPWHTDEIHPYFNFIPGAIFGSPVDDFVLPAMVDEKLRFTQDLSEWEDAAKSMAAPLNDRNMELGMQISPEDALLTRVGTFALDLEHERGMGGGFQELGKDGYKILIYAADAFSLTGMVEVEGELYDFDIHVPEPGFHFLTSGSDGFVRVDDVDGPLLYVVHH